MEMEGEISNFMNIWLQVIASLCYCYMVGKNVPKGFLTLLAILPTMTLFLVLPLHLRTMHFIGMFGFSISWLTNSKLTLFAFNKGPLSDPNLSLKQFIVVACFPIKTHSPNKNSPHHKSLLNYTIKALIFVGVVTIYDFTDYIPSMILKCIYCLHVYLCLEIILGMISVLIRTLFGIQTAPHFDEPYLASSLQDFWGRRWNLATTNILRLTVYEPTRRAALRVFRPLPASLAAVFVTFVGSGFIHELIFYYLGRVRPTWEVTGFFLLQGSCLLIEISCKKKLSSKFRLPRVVSVPLTLAFLMFTTSWLFFPQLLRCSVEQRMLEELKAVHDFVKNATLTLTGWFNEVTSA